MFETLTEGKRNTIKKQTNCLEFVCWISLSPANTSLSCFQTTLKRNVVKIFLKFYMQSINSKIILKLCHHFDIKFSSDCTSIDIIR